MIVCAAPGYWAQHGRPQLWSDLRNHNCLSVCFSNISRPEEWWFGENGDKRVAVKGTLRANNGDALAAVAIACLGVLYEPEFIVADAIRRGELERLCDRLQV